MNNNLPFHLNDITFKYSAMAFRKRQHSYLGLPGEYIRRYPNEIVLRNLKTGRMDELYSVTGRLLINLEEESGDVDEKTMEKCSRYRIFSNFIYQIKTIFYFFFLYFFPTIANFVTCLPISQSVV